MVYYWGEKMKYNIFDKPNATTEYWLSFIANEIAIANQLKSIELKMKAAEDAADPYTEAWVIERIKEAMS